MKINTAILVPCFNEEKTIKKVISDFKKNVPKAKIYVYDNNSTDKTYLIAKKAGAIVRKEETRGKGNVVRRMFSDIEADVYIIIDGDSTYDSSIANKLIKTLHEESLDMIVAKRKAKSSEAYRLGHKFGNRLLSKTVNKMFGNDITDTLSGYRALSKRFVKSFPSLSSGFEIETELTIHALSLKMPVKEIQANYYHRPKGSESKLNTYSDGIRILFLIFKLIRLEKPITFFTFISIVLAILSIFFGLPIISVYLETGLVPRLPTALLSTGIMILSMLSLATGLILDNVTRGRLEIKRLFYLTIK